MDLMVAWRCGGEAGPALRAFAEGLWEILPAPLLATFTSDELLALMNGAGDIDADVLRASARYEGDLTQDSEIVKWFWGVFGSLAAAERGQVLKFVTGAVPVAGLIDVRPAREALALRRNPQGAAGWSRPAFHSSSRGGVSLPRRAARRAHVLQSVGQCVRCALAHVRDVTA